METYESNVNHFENESDADQALLVRFYTKAVQDQTASLKEGRPIFREKEYIEIRFPGTRTDAVARPATPADKDRFPRHYDAFKRRVEMPDEGTPLAEWPMISRTQAEELTFFNVKTVEQLARLSDTHASKFMGINALKQKAQEYIENSKQGVEVSQLKAELAQRDEQIAMLQKQMDQVLMAQQTPSEEPEPEDSDQQEMDFEPAEPKQSTRARKRG